jgi:hypothetical protein
MRRSGRPPIGGGARRRIAEKTRNGEAGEPVRGGLRYTGPSRAKVPGGTF